MKRRIFILPLIALLISSCEIKAKNSNIVSDSTASVPPTSASNEPSSVGETSLGTSIINPPSESASENSDNINSSNTEIPKVIRLQYSGTGSNKKFNEQLFDDFRLARKTTGDPNTYEIEYLEIGPDRIDNEILDWEVGPDVYEFNTDKLPKLYEKGALSKIVNSNAAFIEENNNDYGKDLAKLNGNYYAYPYAIDTSYYVQYDKSFFSAEDVKSIETMLDKAEAAGKKVGYNLQEAYWSGGSMFTFGADYQMTFDEDGAVTNVTADFNTEKGLKAAKAIQKIIKHPAWQNAMEAPTPTNNLVACIAGTWDIAAYKAKLGNNYGVAVMPTVTIAGDTQHLGAFFSGKLFGVNQQRAGKDIDRIVAAHELAKFLSSKEAQLKRFIENDIVPCNIEVSNDVRVVSEPNAKVLIEQTKFAHAQTAVPGNFWTASPVLVSSMIEGTITTEQQLVDAVNTFNDNIKNSSSY